MHTFEEMFSHYNGKQLPTTTELNRQTQELYDTTESEILKEFLSLLMSCQDYQRKQIKMIREEMISKGLDTTEFDMDIDLIEQGLPPVGYEC